MPGRKPISRGSLYLMLRNRLYRGEIAHRGQIYPGEHQAIVDPASWDAVQARLAANAVARGTGARLKNPSLLAGLLFDGEGQPMTATHAVKDGKRYRYYVSRPLLSNRRAQAGGGLRVPAAEIETIVVNRIRRVLSEPARLLEIVTTAQPDEPIGQAHLFARAEVRATEWARMSPQRQRVVVLALLHRVDLSPDRVTIELRPGRLAAFLQEAGAASPDPVEDEPTVPLSQPLQLRRIGKEVRMVIDHTDPFAPVVNPDPTLIKAIVKAHRFNQLLQRGAVSKFAELAKTEKLHRSYYSQILRLAYLAPDITAAILDGRQPGGLTATMLIEHAALPLSWQEQRTALGFA